MTLRAACIHGRYEAHNFIKPAGTDASFLIVHWDDGAERCPGGREVTIDREAAVLRLVALSGWSEQIVRVWVKETLAAAMGDIDDVAAGHPC